MVAVDYCGKKGGKESHAIIMIIFRLMGNNNNDPSQKSKQKKSHPKKGDLKKSVKITIPNYLAMSCLWTTLGS